MKEERKQVSTKAIPKLVPENSSQSRALQNLMSDKPYNFLIGEAGTGKTLMATVYAISKFLDGTYKKIVITRPAVSVDEELGFLPGPQPLDAKVLTPSGWVLMGEIKEGDTVIAWDGTACTVNGVYPKGLKDVYKITTFDGRETEACLDHLWITRSKEECLHDQQGSLKTTRDILNTLLTENGSPNHYLPMNSAVEFSNSDIPLTPYTLGYVLANRTEHSSLTITVDPQDAHDILPRINSELVGSGYYTEKVTDTTYLIRTKTDSAYEALTSLGSFDKHDTSKAIPKEYMCASIPVRIEVLRGLMDAQGTVDDLHGATLEVTSQYMARSIQELVWSLGGTCVISENTDNNGKAVSYKLFMNLPNNTVPFFTERKASKYRASTLDLPAIKSVELVGTKEVQCINIDHPDHLYITNDYIVTHNTIEQKMHPWMLPILDVFMEFFSAEDIEELMKEGLIEIAPLAYMRGRNLGPIDINETSDNRGFIIVADELQNATPEQMKMLLTRLGKNSKMILTGDPSQHDRGMSHNGLTDILERLNLKDQTEISYLSCDYFDKKQVVRSPAVKEILTLYPESSNEGEGNK